MKKIRVSMFQEIHGKKYPFSVMVLASEEGEAKKKAETTFTGYKAI